MTDLATLEFLLMNYAAGSLGPLEALMMASHLALNPTARKKVSAYERIGGNLVHHETPATVTSSCLDAVLARIDQIEKGIAEKPAARDICRSADEFGIPPAIYNIILQAADSTCWEWTVLSDDIEFIDITICPKKFEKTYKGHLRLMRVKPDVQTLHHTHEDGYEITLVLMGSYTDSTGEYATGDLAIFHPHPTDSHAPKAGKEGCLCLVLHDESGPGRKTASKGLFQTILKKIGLK